MAKDKKKNKQSYEEMALGNFIKYMFICIHALYTYVCMYMPYKHVCVCI